MTRDKKAKEVRIFFSKSNPLAYGHKMGQKFKAIRESLVTAAEDRRFYLEERCEERQIEDVVIGREDDRARVHAQFLVRGEELIGREDDKEAIIESLLNPNVKENVSVLPIVGIGGLGKTTVAQLVFNDHRIEKHFELKLWVHVSDNFDVKMIVKIILECVKHKKPEYFLMEMLANDLEKEINGKRYMLVLDDVWNEDREKWFKLKKLLMVGARGGRIVVTTRSQIVAEITKSIQPHVLKGLDEQQAWSLFKKMAFEGGGEPENASFVEIGKEILKMCEGVPLAIRTIGSLLYFKKSEIEWLLFKNNELLKISQNESDTLPTIKLSYDILPSHLKQCFAYCSLFPKNYKIDKSSLIYMWMAQGFIMLHDEKKCLEDVGHEYFMDLLGRSFFDEVEHDELGNILTFKIHDVICDMAFQVLESTIIYAKDKDVDQRSRHVSFENMFFSSSEIPISLYNARRIRTFLLFGSNYVGDKSTFSAIIASFKFMRLLDLHNIGIKTIPSSIKRLKHLRYLDLSMNEDIEMLPKSIVKLYNLQTLKLSQCYKLKELPRNINKLVNLRFLEIDRCSRLTHMPNGLGQLTNLQMLSRFVMSKGRIDSVLRSNGGLKELDRLNELRGNLSIENLKHGKDATLEYKDANLKEKQRLDRLDLNWVEEDIDEMGVRYDAMSLEALQPHVNLKALSLEQYGGVIFPHWLVLLTNLVQFKLYSCNKCQYLPPLDQLPSLKIIHLISLNSLEHISDSERDNSDSLFYPSLEKLEIKECPNLKGWWRGRRDSLPSFPRLSVLEITNSPQLTSFPLFPYLESLDLRGCNLKQSLERMMINNKTSGNLPSIASSSSSPSTIVAPLSKLRYMRIQDTKEALPEECLRNLISLRTLHLCRCPLPQGMRYLTALQYLYVWKSEVVDISNDWDEMEWQGLRTLLSLDFYELPKLVSLPMGLQYVSSLQNLSIWNCDNLIAIPGWICKLISLQSLEICDCPKLESLPEGIGALTSLQTLKIEGCPILLKRCKKQIGEDWHKISHIPNLKGELSRQEEEAGM